MLENPDYTIRLQQKIKGTSKINPGSDCWIWLGQISNSGRGRINIRDTETHSNKTVSAETASYMAFNGEIAEGKLVRQKCGERLCVNPDHLELFEI